MKTSKLTRRLGVVVITIILVSQILLPVVCKANSSIGVVITVVGTTGGISNFTITYVSNTDMHLSWSLNGDAVNIMIRSKYGSYPANIPNSSTTPSDGNLVYYGSGTSFDDTSMNFDQNPGSLYYAAWAQRADGTWYTNLSTGSEESRVVLFIAFVVIALGLTIAAFVAKTSASGMLRIAGVVAWIIMIPLSFAQSWPTTNTYLPVAAALFCAAMMLIMVVATVTYYIDWRNTRRTHEPTDEETQAAYKHQIYGLTKKKSRWD
jgi:uncharacterized membrane protein